MSLIKLSKIYISKNPDYDEVSDFTNDDLSLTSSMGTARLLELRGDKDVVNFFVKISPYKMIVDGDGNEAVLEYSVFDYAITRIEGNINLVLTIKNIEIEKTVFYPSNCL